MSLHCCYNNKAPNAALEPPSTAQCKVARERAAHPGHGVLNVTCKFSRRLYVANCNVKLERLASTSQYKLKYKQVLTISWRPLESAVKRHIHVQLGDPKVHKTHTAFARKTQDSQPATCCRPA
jgi:hypothetical protein